MILAETVDTIPSSVGMNISDSSTYSVSSYSNYSLFLSLRLEIFIKDLSYGDS